MSTARRPSPPPKVTARRTAGGISLTIHRPRRPATLWLADHEIEEALRVLAEAAADAMIRRRP